MSRNKCKRVLSFITAVIMCSAFTLPVYAEETEQGVAAVDTSVVSEQISDNEDVQQSDTDEYQDTGSEEVSQPEMAEEAVETVSPDTDDSTEAEDSASDDSSNSDANTEDEDPVNEDTADDSEIDSNINENGTDISDVDTADESDIDSNMTLDEARAYTRRMRDNMPLPTSMSPVSVELTPEEAEILRRVVEYQYTGNDCYDEETGLINSSFDAYATVSHIKPEGSTDFYYNQMDSRFKQAYDTVIAQIEYFVSSSADITDSGCIKTVILPGKGWTKKEIFALFQAIQASNPQYWFLSPSYYYCANDENVDLDAFLSVNSIDKGYKAADRKTISTAIKNKASSWANEVQTYVTERDKSEKLAELIGKDISYDPVVASGEEALTYYPYTMYSVFCTEYSVCLGYSLAMQYMCDLTGIESVLIQSHSGNHAWNRVKLDGTWYETDITWYDQDIDEKTYDPYKWMNISSDYLYATEINTGNEDHHIPDCELYELSLNGKTISLPECTHTTPYMPFVSVYINNNAAVLAWEDIYVNYYDIYVYDESNNIYNYIDTTEDTYYTITSDMLGSKNGKVAVFSNDVFRLMSNDAINIDLDHEHSYDDKPRWEWKEDKTNGEMTATAWFKCTGCDYQVYVEANVTKGTDRYTASVSAFNKIFTDVYYIAPAKPTVVIKTAFGGRTVQLNCADTDAEIYYNFGSSNITSSCKHVKAGQSIFVNEPMTGNKAAMYFKAYKNGKWSVLGKWGVLNVQIAKPLISQSGAVSANNFKVYTQTKNSYIIYTLDGSTPSIEEGTQKFKVKNGKIVWGTSAVINIPSGKTIKAIAVRCGLVTSDVMSYKNTYTAPTTLMKSVKLNNAGISGKWDYYDYRKNIPYTKSSTYNPDKKEYTGNGMIEFLCFMNNSHVLYSYYKNDNTRDWLAYEYQISSQLIGTLHYLTYTYKNNTYLFLQKGNDTYVFKKAITSSVNYDKSGGMKAVNLGDAALAGLWEVYDFRFGKAYTESGTYNPARHEYEEEPWIEYIYILDKNEVFIYTEDYWMYGIYNSSKKTLDYEDGKKYLTYTCNGDTYLFLDFTNDYGSSTYVFKKKK